MKPSTAFLLILLSISYSVAFAQEAQFTVCEPLGFSRTKEPVIAGMAFKKGTVTDLRNLSLFKGSAEIPAQFDKLVRFEDGSYQWVLCSFIDDFTSKEEKSYVIKKTAQTVSPASAIQITRSGSSIHINNGLISFVVDTVNFTGIKSATYNGKLMIDSSIDGGISVRDEIYGQTTTNGPVSKAGFVYAGAMRATLRVEGVFYTDTCGGMGYSYMITVFAGIPRIKVELQIRNSLNAACGRMARIKRAYTTLPLAFTPTSTPQYDSTINYIYPYWSFTARATTTWVKAYEHNGKGMAVTTNWSGGYHPFWAYKQTLNGNLLETDIVRENSGGVGFAPDTVTAAINDSILLLMDLDVINQDLYLDFYEGTRTSAELGNLRLKQIEASIGRPNAAYLSSTGALSAGRFGTLEDEEASYTKWGWSPATNLRPKSPAKPGLEKSYDDVHYETETDDANGYLLQWIRTGERGFYDQGEAWAKYYKSHYARRTHGFEDDLEITNYPVGTKTRRYNKLPGAPGAWTPGAFLSSRVDVYSWGGCHFYGEGAFDYYCLTGDIDALEGGLDLAETAWRYHSKDDTATFQLPGSRAEGRQLLVITRAYEAMRNQFWLNRMTTRVRMLIKKSTQNMIDKGRRLDPRGMITYQAWKGIEHTQSDSLINFVKSNKIGVYNKTVNGTNLTYIRDSITGKEWPYTSVGGSWEQTYCAHAVERYFAATGDESARDYVIGFGQNAVNNVAYKCGSVPYIIYYDYPRKGMMFGYREGEACCPYPDWSPSHRICIDNHSTTATLGQHEGWYTLYYPGVCANAYKYTGDSRLINKARHYWDYGSKREYQSTKFNTAYNVISKYAFHNAPKDDGLMNTHSLFYESIHHGDTVAPTVISNLSARRIDGTNKVVFIWTAPLDNNGRCAEYQIKFQKNMKIVDYFDYDIAKDESTAVPFWFAENETGEPVPQNAGATETFTPGRDFPKNELWYAVICSRDSSNNLSPVSNLIQIDSNTIGVENITTAVVSAGFDAYPNPFNPSIKFRVSLTSGLKDLPKLTIHDISGRLIKSLTFNQKAGTHFIEWNGRDNSGIKAASGMFVVKLAVNGKCWTKKILMSK